MPVLFLWVVLVPMACVCQALLTHVTESAARLLASGMRRSAVLLSSRLCANLFAKGLGRLWL